MSRSSGVYTFLRAMDRAARHTEAQRRRAYNQSVREERQRIREANRWHRLAEREKIRRKKEQRQKFLSDSFDNATRMTNDYNEQVSQLNQLLENSLSRTYKFDWSALKKKSKFLEVKPVLSKVTFPEEPSRTDEKYQVPRNPVYLVFKSKLKKKEDELERLFKNDKEKWKQKILALTKKQKNFESSYEQEMVAYNKKKDTFYKKQEEFNHNIDVWKDSYKKKDKAATEKFFNNVLKNISNPAKFPNEYTIQYSPEGENLIVNYTLPTLEDIPNVKEVKFIKSKEDYQEKLFSASELKKIYENVLYQQVFRIIYILFKADEANTLSSIVFNGYVNTINKATGKDVYVCVASIQFNKKEFMELNLKNIDAKIAFKEHKGISCAQIETLTPVQPIMQLDKNDKRFVQSYEVLEKVNKGTNLAAIDWKDFENLIREIFEKEFAENGGECKVTQASRDGGVDAIAFDPDPIRGGKIVIQAKRYTNVVDVSAVRDLYGTVVNEGAIKGILVTTSDYGADSYKFVKNKPITLLNGANLLYLLEKYGQKAYIDIKEAKAILKAEK